MDILQASTEPGLTPQGSPLSLLTERRLRLSLYEAAFGCVKRVCGPAWQVNVTVRAGTLDGTVVQPADIQVPLGAQNVLRLLKLTVQIEKHPIFKLVHNRLSVAVPISVWRWAMGGDITVPTLEGSVRIPLPTTPGALLVNNQGWPDGQTAERRPLFVLPKVIYPEQLRTEERRMLELLDVRSNMPEAQGWSRQMRAWQGCSHEPI